MAGTVSKVGDGVTTVALPLVAVKVLDASPLAVSLVAASQYAAWAVIGLPAGVIVGRLPMRETQVAMDLLRAVALCVVPLAALLGFLSIWGLIAVAGVVGLASVVFDVGNAAFLPSVVPDEELMARNSLINGSEALTMIGSPSLGGVLVQVVGAAASLLVDVASYMASALLLWALPRPLAEPGVERPESIHSSIAAGWRYVIHDEIVRPCAAAATCVNFVCGGLMALAPVFLIRTLHASAGLVGLLIATEGVGALLGTAVTTRLAERFGSARTLRWSSLVGTIAALLTPFAGPGAGLILFALGYTGYAASVAMLSILTRTHRQSDTPRELLPRVMATVRFLSWGVLPIGSLTAGAMAEALSVRMAILLAVSLGFLAPLILWASPVRKRRSLSGGA
jgi:MFS family permease